MPWGTHLCVFYDTQMDLFDTVIPYFKAGLESNEFCLWAISEPTADEAKKAFRKAFPESDRYLVEGHIEIVPGQEWYLHGSRLDLKRLVRSWHRKLEEALAKGYDGLRASGNAFWLHANHWKSFCEYEHALEESTSGKAMIVLCTYPLSASRPFDILEVVGAHQFTAVRRKADWEFIETPKRRHSKQELVLELTRDSTTPSTLRETVASRIASLTPRQRQILKLIVDSNTNKQIAHSLRISQRTVENHRAILMKRMGARALSELVRLTIVGGGVGG
jgi:DNA-binding CsgD family transcriptional regulator